MPQIEAPAATATLYERLGGADGLGRIISEIVDAHLENPAIHTRFEPFDAATLKEGAFRFFAQATGGPAIYDGRGLRETHRGMNVNEQELVAAMDDVLAVLQRHGIPVLEQQEVLAAFFAMKGEVLHL